MLAVEPDVRNQETGSCLSERSCQFLVQKAIGYLRQIGYMPAHRRDGALRRHSEQVVADIFDLVMVQKNESRAGIIVGLAGGVGAVSYTHLTLPTILLV